MKRPCPRTSPIDGCSSASRRRPSRNRRPFSTARWRRPSSSITSSTASPTVADTGLPPNVLKYSIPLSKASAMARVVTTAPSGWPLPSGLPIVTMSGTASSSWKDHHGRPDPPESDLDLVGDGDRPGRPGAIERLREEPGWRDDLARGARRRFGDERTDGTAGRGRRLEDRAEICGIGRAGLGGGSAMAPTIRIRQRRDVDMLGSTSAARAVELVRADVDEAARVAVIGALEDGDVAGDRSRRVPAGAPARSPRSPSSRGTRPRVTAEGSRPAARRIRGWPDAGNGCWSRAGPSGGRPPRPPAGGRVPRAPRC